MNEAPSNRTVRTRSTQAVEETLLGPGAETQSVPAGARARPAPLYSSNSLDHMSGTHRTTNTAFRRCVLKCGTCRESATTAAEVDDKDREDETCPKRNLSTPQNG